MCGEALSARKVCEASTGLSPHVRGSPSVNSISSVILGSIPACAGKPEARELVLNVDKVYPRMCGEASSIHIAYQPLAGLSPHVRGSP